MTPFLLPLLSSGPSHGAMTQPSMFSLYVDPASDCALVAAAILLGEETHLLSTYYVSGTMKTTHTYTHTHFLSLFQVCFISPIFKIKGYNTPNPLHSNPALQRQIFF